MNQTHPHKHTLSLLRLALNRLPPTFNGERKRYYEEKLQDFEADPKVGYQDINQVIVDFGKETWAWRKAYEGFYRNFGRSSEEAHLLQALALELRRKYETFIHDGGKVNDLERPRSEEELYRPTPFERYFTPEEKFAIQEALLTAREAAKGEIDGLVSEGKAEDYGREVETWLKRQESIDGKIGKLRELAEVSSHFSPDIRDRVRLMEEGWSVLERGVDEEEVDRELEHWKGMLESFLHH